MTTQPISILADKVLIEALQEPLCSSPGGAVSNEDAFCQSDPQAWPVVNNTRTRLAYPENENSVPGTAYFCADYLSWLGRLAHSDNPELQSANFIGQNASLKGDTDRHLAGLQALSNFCRQVQYGETPPPQTNRRPEDRNPPPPPNNSGPQPPNNPTQPPPDDLGIGKLAAMILGIAAGVGALAYAIAKLGKNTVRLLKVILTGDFAKIFKKPEELTVTQDVVLAQFQGLTPKKGYASINNLELQTQQFVANSVIDVWNNMWRFTRNDLIARGGFTSYQLPWEVIENFAKENFKSNKIDALRAAARAWLANKITNYPPDTFKVLNQIMRYRPSMKNEPEAVQDALARNAILEWINLKLEGQAATVDLTTPFIPGELTSNFISGFVTDENVEAARQAVNANNGRSGGGSASGPAASGSSEEITGVDGSGATASASGDIDNASWEDENDPSMEYEMLDEGILEFFGIPSEPFMDPALAL